MTSEINEGCVRLVWTRVLHELRPFTQAPDHQITGVGSDKSSPGNSLQEEETTVLENFKFPSHSCKSNGSRIENKPPILFAASFRLPAKYC